MNGYLAGLALALFAIPIVLSAAAGALLVKNPESPLASALFIGALLLFGAEVAANVALQTRAAPYHFQLDIWRLGFIVGLPLIGVAIGYLRNADLWRILAPRLPAGVKPSLQDDRYKLWLAKAYAIRWDKTFRQYICEQRLFSTLDEALYHADELYRSTMTDPDPQRL